MSLDVYIKFKEPKMLNYNATHTACGSTMAMVDDGEELAEEWHSNVTHNMGKMADNVKITYYDSDDNCLKDTTLYCIVWRPEELNMSTTSDILEPLKDGINFMIDHRKHLLQFNPANGWGNYTHFLQWLIKYKEACEDNPDCKIEISR